MNMIAKGSLCFRHFPRKQEIIPPHSKFFAIFGRRCFRITTRGASVYDLRCRTWKGPKKFPGRRRGKRPRQNVFKGHHACQEMRNLGGKLFIPKKEASFASTSRTPSMQGAASSFILIPDAVPSSSPVPSYLCVSLGHRRSPKIVPPGQAALRKGTEKGTPSLRDVCSAREGRIKDRFFDHGRTTI